MIQNTGRKGGPADRGGDRRVSELASFERDPDSLAGGAWLIPGRWRIDEVADATGIELPEGEHYETIAGLVMAQLGRIAHPGDTVDVDTVPRHGESDDHTGAAPRRVRMVVVSCSRHVPQAIELRPQPVEVDA